MSAGIPEDKAVLRAGLLAARAGMTEAARAAAGIALTAPLLTWLAGARTVCLYRSLPSEPPTGPLLAGLTAAGTRVLLPVLLPDGDLDWEVLGTGERLGPEAVAAADRVVTPALSADQRGVRLGRGGGAYDRALQRASGPAVAVLFDGEVRERLPEEPHDRRVQAVATPSGGVRGVGG